MGQAQSMTTSAFTRKDIRDLFVSDYIRLSWNIATRNEPFNGYQIDLKTTRVFWAEWK
ncbi:MAG: hypothetical protein ABSH25_22345 [Syntrophorhabdales bacterium]|jgi:hypothetical protein